MTTTPEALELTEFEVWWKEKGRFTQRGDTEKKFAYRAFQHGRATEKCKPLEKTPMVYNCCGRAVCDGVGCQNGGPWGTVPAWRMDAYYYGFEPTGIAMIDKILSAVACAGKCFHNTEDWNDQIGTPYTWLEGNTVVERIQNAANAAAAELNGLKIGGE